MASARVEHTGISPGSLLDGRPSKYKSRGVGSRRSSYGRDNCGEDNNKESDLDAVGNDTGAFEFRIGRNSDAMLPADELFSDGKLLPLKFPTIGCAAASISEQPCVRGFRSQQGSPKSKPRDENSAGFLKSPRRSSRWKELLGFKKLSLNRINAEEDKTKTTPSLPHNRSDIRREYVKNFLRGRRSSKSPADSVIEDKSVSFPFLMKDYDSESTCIPSRISSSSSGGDENEAIAPRLSLDSQKPAGLPRNRAQTVNNRRKVRFVVRRGTSTPSRIPSGAGASAGRRAFDASAIGGFSPDSPRMNPSGKVIFHGGLERSSSSPGSFLSEPPRNRHRGVLMMRSYSANVPVTPILNVPMRSSLRGSSQTGDFGFPLFSSSPKKEAAARSGGRDKNCQGNSRHHNNAVVKTKRQ